MIVFGEGALDYLDELEGNRFFIVTDETIVKLGFLERVVEKLKSNGKEVAYYDKVIPEPPDIVAQECAKKLRKFKPDVIVAIGGGSVMDVAKVSRILNEHPDHPIIDITPLTPITVSKSILVTIPTTSGTGSDATWAAVITDTQDGNKMELTHPELVPYISILDPALTQSMPPKVTASSGMDAIAQAIDGYTVQWRNDFSDGLALHATRLLFQYLPKAYANPDDMEAREKVQNAATISGLAWSNSFLGITHSFGHAMGAVLKMPHGITVGMVLPYSIEYAKKTHANLYGELSRAVGTATIDDADDTATLKLRDAVLQLMKTLEVPYSLKEYGITKAKFDEVYPDLVRFTQESAVNIFNCREPTNEDIERFWHHLFEGKSIDF
jgi:alcohol dehydrogenase class IV